MLEVLQSIGEAIIAFISQVTTFFGKVGQFFTTVAQYVQTLSGLFSLGLPTKVLVFAGVTIFISILWIIIEVI